MACSQVAHSNLEESLACLSCTLVKFIGPAAPIRSESGPWLMGSFIDRSGSAMLFSQD